MPYELTHQAGLFGCVTNGTQAPAHLETLLEKAAQLSGMTVSEGCSVPLSLLQSILDLCFNATLHTNATDANAAKFISNLCPSSPPDDENRHLVGIIVPVVLIFILIVGMIIYCCLPGRDNGD